MNISTKPKRRWSQFSLRTLLIAALAVGGGGGWIGQQYKLAHTPRQPQGMVVWLDQRAKSAYVEFPDGRVPKPSTVFSIYEGDEPITDSATPKAAASVVRVLGPHLVELRFSEKFRVSRAPCRQPLVQGDTVYSAAWKAAPPP